MTPKYHMIFILAFFYDYYSDIWSHFFKKFFKGIIPMSCACIHMQKNFLSLYCNFIFRSVVNFESNYINHVISLWCLIFWCSWILHVIIVYNVYSIGVYRLVMYIERDSRRQTPRDGKAAENNGSESVEYLMQCLDLLINHIVDVIPKLFSKKTIRSQFVTFVWKSFLLHVFTALLSFVGHLELIL